jgi:hypothetical protein
LVDLAQGARAAMSENVQSLAAIVQQVHRIRE